MSPQQSGADLRIVGQIDERESARIHCLQHMPVFGPHEDQVARAYPLGLAVDVVQSFAPLQPEDLREIMRVQPRRPTGGEQDDGQMMPHPRRHEPPPALVFQHINIPQ
jgi:hypothetical protein